MADAERLLRYVETWHRAAHDLIALARELPETDWHRETDLAGWDDADHVAHAAHLESVLAGAPEETVPVDEAPHMRGPVGHYTEVRLSRRAAHDQDARCLPAPIGASMRIDVPEAGYSAGAVVEGDHELGRRVLAHLAVTP